MPKVKLSDSYNHLETEDHGFFPITHMRMVKDAPKRRTKSIIIDKSIEYNAEEQDMSFLDLTELWFVFRNQPPKGIEVNCPNTLGIQTPISRTL